jgi:hypothetical protein
MNHDHAESWIMPSRIGNPRHSMGFTTYSSA